MSESEMMQRIEALLPSLSAIREGYRRQGRELTEAEAAAIREQMRLDMAAGHIDAMENLLRDEVLEKVAGGSLSPTPTEKPEWEDEETDEGSLSYTPRNR